MALSSVSATCSCRTNKYSHAKSIQFSIAFSLIAFPNPFKIYCQDRSETFNPSQMLCVVLVISTFSSGFCAYGGLLSWPTEKPTNISYLKNLDTELVTSVVVPFLDLDSVCALRQVSRPLLKAARSCEFEAAKHSKIWNLFREVLEMMGLENNISRFENIFSLHREGEVTFEHKCAIWLKDHFIWAKNYRKGDQMGVLVVELDHKKWSRAKFQMKNGRFIRGYLVRHDGCSSLDGLRTYGWATITLQSIVQNKQEISETVQSNSSMIRLQQ